MISQNLKTDHPFDYSLNLNLSRKHDWSHDTTVWDITCASDTLKARENWSFGGLYSWTGRTIQYWKGSDFEKRVNTISHAIFREVEDLSFSNHGHFDPSRLWPIPTLLSNIDEIMRVIENSNRGFMSETELESVLLGIESSYRSVLPKVTDDIEQLADSALASLNEKNDQFNSFFKAPPKTPNLDTNHINDFSKSFKKLQNQAFSRLRDQIQQSVPQEDFTVAIGYLVANEKLLTYLKKENPESLQKICRKARKILTSRQRLAINFSKLLEQSRTVDNHAMLLYSTSLSEVSKDLPWTLMNAKSKKAIKRSLKAVQFPIQIVDILNPRNKIMIRDKAQLIKIDSLYKEYSEEIKTCIENLLKLRKSFTFKNETLLKDLSTIETLLQSKDSSTSSPPMTD